MTDPAAITGIAQIAISVKDMGPALAFYRDVLGLTFLFQPGPGLAFLQCGDTRLMLATPNNEKEPRSDPILYFRVADIRAAYDQIRARGAKPRMEPHVVARLETRDVWLAHFDDPDGHVVSLMSEAPR
ncbi:MAG: VOC family protein [Planctomycetes bacterium]|nr:VOC family protein [Planctomycetota bacterium]MBI3847140.1 VOC family protein [Planctomycetota bacterium]